MVGLGQAFAPSAGAGIKTACTVHARHHAGMQTVTIRQIRGSENRAKDFDRDFNPLRDHNQARWLKIASARKQKALPAVELVQVGDVYFVRDGHHRISVAQALGQLEIEANVVLWQVKGPLPWDKHTRPQRLTRQPSLRDLVMSVGMRLRVRMAF